MDQEVQLSDEIFQWPIAIINILDVWDYMFQNYITSPIDQNNLLLASPQYFGPFLESRKCSILFGTVLHVLHNHKYLDVSKAELLQYRTISKSCMKSMDRSLRLENPCFQNLDGMDHDICDPLHVCWNERFLRFTAGRRIERLALRIQVENLTSSTSSPFPCGSLTFPGMAVFGHDSMLSSFRQVISTFGTSIYHFRYHVLSDHFPWSTVYALLVEFLERMPNLRTLEIHNHGNPDYTAMLQVRPLPLLNQLEMLTIKNTPAAIVNAFLQRCVGRLEKLSIQIGRTRPVVNENHWYDTRLLSGATSLLQLSIGVIYTPDSIARFLDEDESKSLQKLRSVSVSMIQRDENRSNTIFKELCDILLQHFGESRYLRTLNLTIQHPLSHHARRIVDVGQPEFLCCGHVLSLPSVKRLWIYVGDVLLTSIDFILGLQVLEELVINMEFRPPSKLNHVEKINFVHYWSRMEESNVWKLMPNLKKITFRVDLKRRRLPECYVFYRPILNALS